MVRFRSDGSWKAASHGVMVGRFYESALLKHLLTLCLKKKLTMAPALPFELPFDLGRAAAFVLARRICGRTRVPLGLTTIMASTTRWTDMFARMLNFENAQSDLTEVKAGEASERSRLEQGQTRRHVCELSSQDLRQSGVIREDGYASSKRPKRSIDFMYKAAGKTGFITRPRPLSRVTVTRQTDRLQA